MKRKYTLFLLISLLLAIVSCSNKAKTSGENTESTTKATVNIPNFNADSAYQYVKAQVEFGPRVPNTTAHVACGNYLAAMLAQFGATVTNQYTNLSAFNGTLLKARNIIGSYNPENKKRIAIFSHWDSRPWADADPDKKNHHKPILGANDGASGVGVMLEIARQIQQQQPELGIDLIFLDAEDYGDPGADESWGLGAQYWARNPHVEGYTARFGILLDMVGAKNATFRYEGYSQEKAPNINQKVWNAAASLDYGRYFIKEEGGRVTDDHTFINDFAHIPTIDIIHTEANGEFYKNWHTIKDDMEGIDRATLGAVGQTLLQVIYNEK